MAITAEWITAADGDRKRHLAALDGGTWRALCGVQFRQPGTGPDIPRRCLMCADQAAWRTDVEIVSSGTADAGSES